MTYSAFMICKRNYAAEQFGEMLGKYAGSDFKTAGKGLDTSSV